MNPGELDQRVVFETIADVQGSAGGLSVSPTTLATRWAKVEPLQGRELFEAQQLASRVDHRVIVRHDSITETLTTKHRMKLGTRVFDILQVINRGEQDREIELLVREAA